MIQQNNIEENRRKVIELLRSTGREGIENVIHFLGTSDYFTIKGSYRHHVFRGGLAAHSLGVYKRATNLNKDCDENSVIICALLHDICKVSRKFRFGHGGHGRCSVKILGSIGFSLKSDEWRAIRFHMAKKRGRVYNDNDAAQYEIASYEHLRQIIHWADCTDASYSGSNNSRKKSHTSNKH